MHDTQFHVTLNAGSDLFAQEPSRLISCIGGSARFDCVYTASPCNDVPVWKINNFDYYRENLPMHYSYQFPFSLIINEVETSMNLSTHQCIVCSTWSSTVTLFIAG